MDATLPLPSAGPEPIGADDALAAVVGYAAGPPAAALPRAQRPRGALGPGARLRLRPLRPAAAGDLGPDDRPRRAARRGAARPARPGGLDRGARPPWTRRCRWRSRRCARAAGRAFWELPEEETSVLVRAGHRRAPRCGRWPRGRTRRTCSPRCTTAGRRCSRCWTASPGGSCGRTPPRATAACTRWCCASCAPTPPPSPCLEARVRAVLGHRLTRLRLHDVLLWLAGSLRMETAVALGPGRRGGGRLRRAGRRRAPADHLDGRPRPGRGPP